jgi:hypothetical protein
MATVIEPLKTTNATAATGNPLVRVVKGNLAAEELAALTAVLLARATVTSPVGKAGSVGKAEAQARWQRLERRPGYSSPVSWHS